MWPICQWLSSCFRNMRNSFSLLLVNIPSLGNISSVCSQSHQSILQFGKFGKLDLIRSIVRYGYSSYSTFPYPTQLRLLRIPYVFSILDFSNTNLRVKADVYSLEATEKSYISYELGMIFAHLIAERQENLIWTLHLGLASRVGINIVCGDLRPDLIGYDGQGGYYVIEAKGTLSKCKEKTIRDAKSQLLSVATINESNPQRFVSYFVSLENKDSKAFWIDPEGKGDIDLKIEMKDFIFLHYFYFMQLIQSFEDALEDKKIKGHNFKIITLGNICIGLEKEIFGELREVMTSWSKFKTSKSGKNKIFEYDINVELFKKKVEEIEKLKLEIENDDNISLGRDGSIVTSSSH